MKYKYTRKECNKEIETIKRIFSGSQIMPGGWLETVTQYLHATQLMLLAQKEDRKPTKKQLKYWERCGNGTVPSDVLNGETMQDGKECEHNYVPFKNGGRGICLKCGQLPPRLVKQDQHTPSPLEIEELKISSIKPENATEWSLKIIAEKINELISNQKKLYQYIKEKI